MPAAVVTAECDRDKLPLWSCGGNSSAVVVVVKDWLAKSLLRVLLPLATTVFAIFFCGDD